MAQDLAPFTFFLTSTPTHLEAHLSAHDVPAQAVQDIAARIKSFEAGEVVVCVTNDFEQLHCEVPHFLYDLEALKVIEEIAADRVESGLLLRVSFIDVEHGERDLEIAQLAQWQKDTYRIILQVMAGGAPTPKALADMRQTLSSLSRLQFFLLAKKTATKRHDVAQIMTRAEVQQAIRISVDGVKHSLLKLCNTQAVSSTGQIKVRARLTKLEAVSRVPAKVSPRAAAIVNTKHNLQKLISLKSEPDAAMSRSLRLAKAEPVAKPTAKRSFKESAVVQILHKLQDKKPAAVKTPETIVRSPQAFTDFKRATAIVSASVVLPVASLTVANLNVTPQAAEKASVIAPVQPVVDQPVVHTKEALPHVVAKIAEPIAVARVAPERPAEIPTQKADVIKRMKAEVVIDKLDMPRVIKDEKIAVVAKENTTRPTEPGQKLLNEAIVTKENNVQPQEVVRRPVREAAAVAEVHAQILPRPVRGAQPVETRVGAPAQEKLVLAEVPQPVAEAPVKAPEKLADVVPVTKVETAAPKEIKPAALRHEESALPEDNVLTLTTTSPVQDAEDSELARLKALKKNRKYSQTGLC